MTRVATTNYAGSPDTTFEWATAGSDRFSRVKDLYALAQALETHNHTAGKGLAVGRVINGLIDTPQLAAGSVDSTKLGVDAVTAIAVALDAIGALELADNAVDTAALQNLAVTLAKMAANSVDNTKLVAGSALANLGYTPVDKAGDTGIGGLGLTTLTASGQITSTVATGTPPFVIASTTEIPNSNASRVASKIPTATPAAGALPLADGSGKLDAWVTSAAGVPSGIGSWVPTAAAIPSGWARYNALDGRMPVGAGTTFSVTYLEDTNYGSAWSHASTNSNHQHTAGSLNVAGNTNGASGDEFSHGAEGSGQQSNNSGHTHAASLGVNNSTSFTTPSAGTDSWVIPSRAVVWIRKS